MSWINRHIVLVLFGTAWLMGMVCGGLLTAAMIRAGLT